MGIATHLGPWLLGTVKNTTGSTAGTVRNTGGTTVGQFAAFNATTSLTGTLGYLPAGAVITNAYMYTTTLLNGTPTIVISVSGTAVTVTPTFTGGVFNGNLGFVQSTAAGALLANVGTTDAAVTYTIAGAGTSSGVGVIFVEYMVRNADGSLYPTSFTGP